MAKKSTKEMYLDRVSMGMQRMHKMPNGMPMKDSDMKKMMNPNGKAPNGKSPNKSSKKKGK